MNTSIHRRYNITFKTKLISWMTLLLCCVFLSGSRAVASGLSFTGCYQENAQPPYYMALDIDKPEAHRGVYLDILRAAARQIDLEIRFIRNPWKRCLSLLKLGKVDGVFAASFKTERAEFAHYPFRDGQLDESRRILDKSYYLYRLKGTKASWDGNNFQALKRPGIPLGYSIAAKFREREMAFIEVRSSKIGFEMLVNRSLDGFATLEAFGDYLLANYPDQFHRVETINTPLQTKPYFLIISQKFYAQNKEVAETLWQAIGEIRSTRMNDFISKHVDQ